MKIYKSFKEFTEAFSTNEACLEHLSNLKWGNGYKCFRCANTECIKGRTSHHRRCRNCGYDESCTAHTLFHKIKFPIVKAFWIIYQIGTMKKGMSTLEISRQYHIHQETAWFFKRKIQQAMNHLLDSKLSMSAKPCDVYSHRIAARIEVSGIFLEFKRAAWGSQKGNRSIARARLITDRWPELDGNLTTKRTLGSDSMKAGKPDVSCLQINLRNWMRGIHHRVSIGHLQYYFNEYSYRLKRRKIIRHSVPHLFDAMVVLPWLPYSTVICGQNR